jgi:hypothetical protein
MPSVANPTYRAGFSAPGGGGTQSSSSTYFPQQNLLPAYLQPYATGTFDQAQNAQGQYMNYISNPTGSPLFQNALSGLLNSLIPSEKMGAQNLGDQFRAMGNMSSGIYGNAAANYQGDILRNRQTMASQLLAQQFPQMVQALMAPQGLAAQLAAALKLQQSFGAPQMGGGGGGGDLGFATGSMPLSGGGSSPYNPFGPAYQGGLFNSPGMTGVNSGGATTSPYTGLDASTLENPYFSSGGSTLFMPNGNYVSGSNTSAGLYNPAGYTSFDPFQPFTDTNYGYNNPTETISGEY